MADTATDSFTQIKDGDWDNLNRSLRYIYNQLNAITGNPKAGAAGDQTYIPVFTNLVNINNGPVGQETRYVRIMNVVIVFGEVIAGTTLGATDTSFDMSLPPIPAKLLKPVQGAGVAYSLGNSAQGASILAGVANQTAHLEWVSVGAAIESFSFVFVYALN
jgi:hypothetical protein